MNTSPYAGLYGTSTVTLKMIARREGAVVPAKANCEDVRDAIATARKAVK